MPSRTLAGSRGTDGELPLQELKHDPQWVREPSQQHLGKSQGKYAMIWYMLR